MGTPKTDSLNTEVDATNQPPVDWEKRYKDVQAFATTSRQELARLKAENEVLKANTYTISPEQQAVLDDMKFKDPDKWLLEMNKISSDKDTKLKEAISLKTNEVLKDMTLSERNQALNDFNSLYKVNLTPELLQNEIPARIHKKLDSGEIDYPTYLAECTNYLKTPKVVGNGQEVMGQPNLGLVGGGTTPTDAANNEDVNTSYAKAVW